MIRDKTANSHDRVAHPSKPMLWRIYFSMVFATSIGCQSGEATSPRMEPPSVTVAKPIRKQIVEWDAYTGRLEATAFVEVRARVSGYLQSTHFDEGQVVNKGDLLFVVDPRPFEAELESARAALGEAESQLEQSKAKLEEAKAQQQQSQAQLALAGANMRRAKKLGPTAAISQEELDQREAEFLQAKADVEASNARIGAARAAISTAAATIESANAGIQTAELNVDYTRVRAPVTGRVSREFVTEGNLISGGTATSTLLTTIASVDPIYCTFYANEQEVLKYVRLARSGKRQSSRVAKNPVYLGLVDERGFPHTGHMDFVDNRFDADTATMRARSIFRNPEQVLLPGMFAQIRIPGSAPYEAVLIPDAAIGTDQSDQYVYVVVDGKIERRAVALGPIVDGLRVVRDGLTGDESVVIEGLLQARPGAQVQTKDGEIEAIEDGLPDHYEPLPPEKWISPEADPTSPSDATNSRSSYEPYGDAP